MNLEELRAVQVDERGTDSLQPLPADFYREAADFVAELRDRRDREAERVEAPFDSAEVRQLTDEIETAEEVVEAIYERRIGKLVKRASLAASGVSVDEAGLTDEEQVLFADLVERISDNRTSVLDTIAAGADAPVETEPRSPPPDSPPTPPENEPAPATDEAPSDPPEDPEPDGGAAQLVASEPVAESTATEADDTDRLTVRITADVGEIYGVDDRVYTLGAEDVVTLPSANAKPLLDRGAAQRVE